MAFSESMLAVFERRPFALGQNVGFKGLDFVVTVGQRLAADGVFDAPVDRVPEQGDPPELDLVFWVGLRVSVGGVGVTHVAGDADRAAQGLCVVEDAVALLDELLGRSLPNLLVPLAELLIDITGLYLRRALPALLPRLKQIARQKLERRAVRMSRAGILSR